ARAPGVFTRVRPTTTSRNSEEGRTAAARGGDFGVGAGDFERRRVVKGQVRQEHRRLDFGLGGAREMGVGLANRAMVGIDRGLLLGVSRRLAVVTELVRQLALLREQQEQWEQDPIELAHDCRGRGRYGATAGCRLGYLSRL